MKRFFSFSIIGFLIFIRFALAASSVDLNNTISQKNQNLQKINSQIQEIQNNLENTQKTKRTLKKEVAKFNLETKQVELGITASKIIVEKLGSEINHSKNKISGAEEKIAQKKEAIAQTMELLHQADHENLLAIILGNSALSEKVLAAEGLNNLNQKMQNDIADLQSLQNDLSAQIGAMAQQKKNKEQENSSLNNRKIILEEIKKEKQSLLAATQNQEKNYQAQLNELERQQLAISDEISRYEEELRRGFNVNLLPAKRPGVFSWPVILTKDNGPGRITQLFGKISRLYRGRPHNGLDIAAPIGTPVYAAADGIVMTADNNDRSRRRKYQYGKYVFIKHNNNLSTLYAHLSKYIVQTGQTVKRGEVIGYVGATGYAFGSHLHFGAYWSASVSMKAVPPAAGLVPVGVVIDPEDYL